MVTEFKFLNSNPVRGLGNQDTALTSNVPSQKHEWVIAARMMSLGGECPLQVFRKTKEEEATSFDYTALRH